MIISLSPCVALPGDPDAVLTLEKTGADRLRINGELFNFHPLPEGAEIPPDTVPCGLIIGPVARIDGEVRLTLRFPVPADCNDPAMCFPEPINVTDDGPVSLPVATEPVTQEEPDNVDA